MLNRIELLGNIGRDPELRHTKAGTPFCFLSLATTYKPYSKDGPKEPVTTWHNIVCWGKLAELVVAGAKKGMQAYIEGRMECRRYDDKDGQKQEKWQVNAQLVRWFARAEKAQEQAPANQDDDNIPF